MPKLKQTKQIGFESFARLMGKAVRLGREHRVAGQAQSTMPELIAILRVPRSEVQKVYVLYLCEAYLAGYRFVDPL